MGGSNELVECLGRGAVVEGLRGGCSLRWRWCRGRAPGGW